LLKGEPPTPPVKMGQAGQGLPGNVDMIARSAFLPAQRVGHPADLPEKGGVPMTKEEFYLLMFTGSE
jgi:hypothetical protein